MDLETWACPTCLSGLEETAEGLQCRSEGRVFPRRDGLPVLVRPEEEGLLADAESYATAWRRALRGGRSAPGLWTSRYATRPSIISPISGPRWSRPLAP